MFISLHVKYPVFLSDFNETWIFSTDLKKKFSNIKYHVNASNGSQVVPWGKMDGQTWRSFNSFLNALKNMKIKTEPSFCGMYRAENGVSA